VTCTQKEDAAKIVKNHNPTITTIPDELWNEFNKILPKKSHPGLLVDQ
jgi:hypothetical protein